MLFSKKILISLLVFGLINPVLASTESEKEDPNRPYYYIAASIVFGAVGLGVFFKTHAIKGWFKKESPTQSVEERPLFVLKETITETLESLPDNSNGSDPSEGVATNVLDVAPLVAALVVSNQKPDESSAESTTTASSTVALAPKKPERRQQSPEFLANKKFLEQHLAQIRGTVPRARERVSQLKTAVGKGAGTPTTCSESTAAANTAMTEPAENPTTCQPTRKSRNTITNDPEDGPPAYLPPECLVEDQQPSQFQLPVLYHASENINSIGHTQIIDEARNLNIDFGTLLDAVWIVVCDQYEDLNDYMGVSLPSEPHYIYCFVNPDLKKMIFPSSRELNKGLSRYNDGLFSWWRIKESSHSTVCIRIAQPGDLPQEDVKSLEQEKKEIAEEEKQEKKGKEEKKHFWSRKK